MTVTTHDVAMRLVRGRGKPCNQPEFIAAYLTHEDAKFRTDLETHITRVCAALAAAQDHADTHSREQQS